MNTVRFSLILACLSNAETLRVTLESIAKQDFDAQRLQVIVVDDASDPPLKSVIPAFCESTDADVVYLRNPINLGRAATRNRGISAALGEILVFMDVDQYVEPTFLSELDLAFGKVTDRSVRANTAVLPSLLAGSAFLRFYNSRFLGNRPASELARIGPDRLRAKYYATGCIATGSESVRQVGGFDESFRNYGCEDEELGLRLEKAGVPLSLLMEAKSYSTDDSLNVVHACRRLREFAGRSIPILLSKHPDYASQLPLAFLHLPDARLSFSKRMVKLALLGLYRPSLAEGILSYLEKNDSVPSFRPPGAIYRIAFLGFFLDGVRLAREVQG